MTSDAANVPSTISISVRLAAPLRAFSIANRDLRSGAEQSNLPCIHALGNEGRDRKPQIRNSNYQVSVPQLGSRANPGPTEAELPEIRSQAGSLGTRKKWRTIAAGKGAARIENGPVVASGEFSCLKHLFS
jgi:hypothetical protein